MQAFHNDQTIKSKYLTRVLAHQEADEIIKGKYWEKGKGCAVGCTIHSGNHKSYETELGIPQWLARVEDRIFEGLPNKRAKFWPGEFLDAINIGSDLEQIKLPFLIFVCESTLEKFDHKKFPKSKSYIDSVLIYLKDPLNNKRPTAAAYATATADAADAAAYAADAAAYAAYAAAYAAADAADAAADAAAYAAYAAAYAAAAYARENEYVKFADKLLELIRDCK